jgi:DNA-binding MarR family transcriptional regulator
MNSNEPLEPCPYRESRLGYLLCKVSTGGRPCSDKEYTETNLTTERICRTCPIPEITKQVNCLNLDLGKYHPSIISHIPEIGQTYNFDENSVGISINCSVVGFSRAEDYCEKCSIECASFKPIHRSISNEERISIDSFDVSTPTDRTLRQAVLAILYRYHAQYPERFNCFDVTPVFISECLGITVQDVVRVVAPMEEEGEVTTMRYAHDVHFRYVTIRSKGIRMIDEEPLFERLNTAQVRSQMNFYGPVYAPAGNVQGNQSILEKD